MKLTKFSLCLALILSLPFGPTAAQAQDAEQTPRGIQTIRLVQGQEQQPGGAIQVQGKSIIVVDKDGKKTEIPIEGSRSVTITQSTQETEQNGEVERWVMGKAIIVGPDGKQQEIELDGGFSVFRPNGQEALDFYKPATANISKFFIGVHCEPVDDTTREELRLDEKAGLKVIEVTPDSPAQTAGLQQDDILLYANDSELGSREQLIEAVQKAGEANDELALSIVRDGKEQKVVVRPAERPAMPEMPGLAGMGGLGVLPRNALPDLNVGEAIAPEIEALQRQMEGAGIQLFVPNVAGVEGGLAQRFAIPMPGIIQGMPPGFDPQQFEQLKDEMESARKQLEQAREEMERAQVELRKELQQTQREIREQLEQARKQLEKAAQELRKSKQDN